MLIRTPALSEVDQVISFCDVSLNSEIKVIRALSKAALKQHKIHSIILMIEMGDFREGATETELIPLVKNILSLKGVSLMGIGTNFACLSHLRPHEIDMTKLETLACRLEKRFSMTLSTISGGNSSSLELALKARDGSRINQIRIGDTLLTGLDPLSLSPVNHLKTDSIRLVGEIIEMKSKGIIHEHRPQCRAILNFGYQDTDPDGLKTESSLSFLGSTSNHTVFEPHDPSLKLGSELTFSLTYKALLQAFSSPNVYRVYFPVKSKEVL
jgi:ornithine racemase